MSNSKNLLIQQLETEAYFACSGHSFKSQLYDNVLTAIQHECFLKSMDLDVYKNGYCDILLECAISVLYDHATDYGIKIGQKTLLSNVTRLKNRDAYNVSTMLDVVFRVLDKWCVK